MYNQIQQEKDWTILIYCNGNNELEPEMYQDMLNAEKVGSNANVNVVLQLGRAKYELVKFLRLDLATKADNYWSGVRRYLVTKGSSTLVDNLKNINMAHPRSLYDFIKWGMRFYPAKKYMLVLGGHGYQFVGMMTDYSRKAPYIMGLPEMVTAINMAANNIDEKIDVLVLDTCYFNSIEILYELGRDENHSVMNVITHIKNGPLEGLPYDRIIGLVQENSEVADITTTIRNIIDNLSYDLVAYKINHQTLKQIKQLFSDSASAYLSRSIDSGDATFQGVSDVLSSTTQAAVSNLMSSLVIHFKSSSQSKTFQGLVAGRPSSDDLGSIIRYCRLSFAQDNCWTTLLNNKIANANINIEHKENLVPVKMRPDEVYAYISIMNPGLTEARKIEMLKDLYQYKSWI